MCGTARALQLTAVHHTSDAGNSGTPHERRSVLVRRGQARSGDLVDTPFRCGSSARERCSEGLKAGIQQPATHPRLLPPPPPPRATLAPPLRLNRTSPPRILRLGCCSTPSTISGSARRSATIEPCTSKSVTDSARRCSPFFSISCARQREWAASDGHNDMCAVSRLRQSFAGERS